VAPIGAVIALPLDRSRFIACRVLAPAPEPVTDGNGRLRHRGPLPVWAVSTRWIGTRGELASALGDPRIRRPFRLTHHAWGGWLCGGWVAERPPRAAIVLGTLAPRDTERAWLTALSSGGWTWMVNHWRTQLAWNADPARARTAWRAERAAAQRARDQPAPAAKPVSLARLARRARFAEWSEPLRGRARRRVDQLIARLKVHGPDRALATIAACARAFNREHVETLDREELDDALCAIARAVGIDDEAYRGAIDAVRDW